MAVKPGKAMPADKRAFGPEDDPRDWAVQCVQGVKIEPRAHRLGETAHAGCNHVTQFESTNAAGRLIAVIALAIKLAVRQISKAAAPFSKYQLSGGAFSSAISSELLGDSEAKRACSRFSFFSSFFACFLRSRSMRSKR